MNGRGRILGYGGAAGLVVAGTVGGLALPAGAGEITAMLLIGIGLVLVVSLVFLEIGLSEDCERDRERSPTPGVPDGPGEAQASGPRGPGGPETASPLAPAGPRHPGHDTARRRPARL